jgi:hypothetical protein
LKKISEAWWWPLGMMAFWLGVMVALYGPIIAHPDAYMFSNVGDGIKNYFTFAWHVRYDADWISFGGMNYPNGEHVCYTDGHPLISLFAGWIPLVQHHPVGTLNVLMLFGLLILPLTLYGLLREVGVKHSVAVVGALCITWLNPQLLRLPGHYALSYAWAIPLAMLFVVQFFKQPSASRIFNILVLSIALFFVHPYLGMCISLLSVGVFGLKPFFELKAWRLKWKEWLFGWSAIVVPIGFYLWFMTITDTHALRAPDAKGYLEYTASLRSLLVPVYGPFRNVLLPLFSHQKFNWEGYAYLGVGTMFLLLIAITFKWRSTLKSMGQNKWWPLLLITALGAVFFACGIPFLGENETWLHNIPYLEQFRAPGRFVWLFYFIVGVWIWFLLNEWLLNSSTKVTAAVLGTLLVLTGIDGFSYQHTVAGQLYQKNVFSEHHVSLEDLAELDEIMAHESPKAIVPIPFFHYGSDYYSCSGNEEAKSKAFAMAYLSGVPLMASANPRVSLSESRNHLQFFSGDFTYKQMWDTLPDGSALYVLRCGDPILPVEKRMVENGTRWLKPEFEKPDWQERIAPVLDVAEGRVEPFTFDPIMGFVDTLLVVSEPAEAGRQAVGNEYHVVAKFNGSELIAHREWQASVWVYWSDLNALFTQFVVEEKIGERSEWIAMCDAGQCSDTYQDSVLMRLLFSPKPDAEYIIFTKGSDAFRTSYRTGTFMLQPAGKALVQPGEYVRIDGIPLPKVR